jgi:predicted  nucleic acid-binding Zn-ribbon protein
MSNIGQELYALQQIDLEMREKQSRLDAIATALGADVSVKKAQTQLETSQAALKTVQAALKDLERQVQTVETKRKSSEERLYSGVVSNVKELQDLENNIAALKKQQDELENRSLDNMESLENAESLVTKAEQSLQERQKKVAAANSELLSEKVLLESSLSKLDLKRQKASAAIDKNSLDLYESLRPKMAFRPVARLNHEGACSVCGIEQTKQHAQAIRQDEGLGRCENCKRILIP